MRYGLLSLLALTEAPALAEERTLAVGAAVTASSMIIDRGEQLSDTTLESEIVLEWAGETDVFYAGAYRLSPVGQRDEAFAEEVDYFVGYARNGPNYTVDVSAAWLSYPGEGSSENSLEVAGLLSLDSIAFQPELAAFYDARFEDWGLELTAGPGWIMGDWANYARLRVGFVSPGDGSETRNYIGFEAGSGYPLTDNVEFGVFVRGETADQPAFADDYAGGDISAFRKNGVAFGISLSAAS